MTVIRPRPNYLVSKENIIALLTSLYPDRSISDSTLNNIVEYTNSSLPHCKMDDLHSVCSKMEPYLYVIDFVYQKPENKESSCLILLYGLIIIYGEDFKHNYHGSWELMRRVETIKQNMREKEMGVR